MGTRVPVPHGWRRHCL